MTEPAEKKYRLDEFLLVSPRTDETLSQLDLAFWQGNPPAEIVIASASMRRGLMAAYLMSGLRFPGFVEEETVEGEVKTVGKHATDLQKYFRELIPNGDGKLPVGEKVLLGYYHGVPLFIERQEGETKSNDAVEQAERKVRYLGQKYRENFPDKDVLIVAIDTVDGPDTISHQLGKPENMDEFKTYDPAEHAGLTFDQYYLQTYFPPGTTNNHHNAIALLRTSEPEDKAIPIRDLELHLQINEHIFAQLEVFHDCGGGGVCQQVVNWLSDLRIAQAMPEDMKAALEDAPASVWGWALYSHITGMPWWAVDQMIAQQYGRMETI